LGNGKIKMDKSQTNIKMCEKAEEIQLEQDKGEGNYFVVRSLIRKGVYQENIIISGYPHFYWLDRYDSLEPANEWVGYYDGNAPIHYKGKKIIWLPQQDQLQKIMLRDTINNSLIALACWFSCVALATTEASYFNRFDSMEQLWLAFVMKEKFGKVWDGEDWVKEMTNASKSN